jgi:hypothetical protein
MPAFAKKQPPKPDLGADIERLRSELTAFLEERLASIKLGRDGAGLPVEVLRQQLMRGDNCLCRVVGRLLNESI